MRQLEHTLQHLTSPKRSHTFWGLAIVLIACFCLLWLKHGDWLQAPNDYLLGGSPDCFKNYMTSIWHVRHDTSFVHYSGMNYPFGEHVLFTDNQPFFSSAMQWWSRNVSDLTGRTVGVINIFQIISILLGCGVLFLLLRKLHLPVWYAGLVTLGMVFLNPQYGRFDAHFALSHTWVFPLLLLLLCYYEERHSRRYLSLLIGTLVWVAAQFHFYYFGLCALFLGLYTMYQWVREPSLANFRRRFSHLIVMVVVPFALLNLWLHWTDYSTDRPSNPYGIMAYYGQWEGVLLPYGDFPLFKWIEENIIHIRRVNGETMAYAGALALLFTLWLLKSRFRMFDKTWDEAAYHRTNKRFLQGILAAAFILLVFACGFPYAIKGCEWMVNYMGPLRQFRSMGRFTWAYFYVANILAFYIFWNWSLRHKGFGEGLPARLLRGGVALLPVLLIGWEAYTYQRLRPVGRLANLEKREVAAPAPDHWLNKVDFSKYQALLPLPYYHFGSENLWMHYNFDHHIRLQTTALHTGVPDMGVNMSRTSCSQTISSAQFVLEPCQMPTMLNELLDNRPLALFVHAPAWDDVRKRYAHLIDGAKLVYENPEVKILSLPIDSVRAAVPARSAAVEAERLSKPLQRHGVWQVPGPTFLHYVSFDSLAVPKHVFQGKSAFTGNMKDTTWLWQAPLSKGNYALSFWVYVKQDMSMNHELKLYENDQANGAEMQYRHEGMHFHLKAMVNDWALYEMPFEVRSDNAALRMFLFKEHGDQPFVLDEVLIRPQWTDVYRRLDDWTVRNNYWYRF
ncbi:MAG: hypothetical protein ACKVU2_02205 [Saprospiraceae bacterium]